MITYKLKINYQDPRILTSDMEFVTGDVGAYRLEFAFYDNGRRVDVSDCILSVKARRADGRVLSDAGQITDGVGIFVPKNDIYAVPGELSLEVALADSAQNYLTAKILQAAVVEGMGETDDTAGTESSVYVTLINRVQSQLSAANQLLSDSKINFDNQISALSDALSEHAENTENPHAVTKAQVGLGNADNTKDADKPVSKATQAALDLKANAADVYTKTESDEKLNLKANAADVYTKSETDSRLAAKADAKTSDGGFSGGADSEARNGGGAVGANSFASYGGALGKNAKSSNGSGAVGNNASASLGGGAVGNGARAGKGFSGGEGAVVVSKNQTDIDAIQLGSGTNSTEKSLQVYEYQLMGADGKIPKDRLSGNCCSWGGCVSSIDDLPASPSAGTFCYVAEDFINGVKYTGRVGDLFSCDGGDLWSYTLLFTPPSKCVYTEPDVTVNPSYTFIYDANGVKVGSISIDPTEMPGAFDASLLGVSNADDTVTFYLGIWNGNSFPSSIKQFNTGNLIVFDGTNWQKVKL